MKKLLLGLLGLIVLIIAGAVIAPFFIPVDVYKNQITVAARDATGRDLVIDGDVSLSIFPRLELQAEEVKFSNVAGGRAPQMASLKELIVRLQLMPLLSGEVRVDSFVLVDPVIALEVDPDGNSNWTFDTGTAPEPEAEAQDTGSAPALTEISLGDVRLENGKVSYRDARNAQVVELSDINMSVSLPSLDAPFELDGSVVWNKKQVGLTVGGASARALMDGNPSAVKVELDVDVVSVEFDGSAKVSEPLAVAGDVSLEVPSIRNLAAWTGSPIDAPGEGLGPLSIAGDLDMKGAKVSFNNAKIGLDGMAADGDFMVDTSGKVPYLKGRLDWDRLDLNLYVAEGSAPAGAAEEAQGPADWSDEEIDFSGLKSANADFDLSVGEILIDKMKIGKSAVKVGLKDGRLAVNLSELALYEGAGTANIVINARSKVPLIQETISVTGVQLEPLLTDAAGFDRMDGTGNLKISVNTHGRSERQLVAGLNGTGSILFADGAIRGVNIGEMIRNSASAFLGKTERNEASTEYAEMKGTFTITNGVVSNQDLYLVGPYAEVTGSGAADMNQRTVKYRVVPKATLSASDAAGAGGVTVPVIVSGSWDDPSFRPDLKALVGETIKDPKKAVKDVKKTIKAIKKEGIGGLLEGLANPSAPASTPAPADGDGGGEETEVEAEAENEAEIEGDGEETSTTPSQEKVDPKQLLKGLLGG